MLQAFSMTHGNLHEGDCELSGAIWYAGIPH